VQLEDRPDQMALLALGEVGDDRGLGDLVQHQQVAGDGADEQQKPAGTAQTSLVGRDCLGDQRRSWRCLSATQSVARGNACRRSLPIGFPQISQTP
jgi:hypothetical protein